MCNDSEQKYYVMDAKSGLSGPHNRDNAYTLRDSWDRTLSNVAPHRVVTIVATEVPEPPKVSRVVTRKADGACVRFHDDELFFAWSHGGEFTRYHGTPKGWIDGALSILDYAFVRDFAALCEEVLGGGK